MAVMEAMGSTMARTPQAMVAMGITTAGILLAMATTVTLTDTRGALSLLHYPVRWRTITGRTTPPWRTIICIPTTPWPHTRTGNMNL